VRIAVYFTLIVYHAGATAGSDVLLLSAGVRSFDYVEYSDSGNFLDGEFGSVWGADFSWIRALPNQNQVYIEGGIFAGDVRYDGSTQGGTALQTNTHQHFYNAGLGYRMPFPGHASPLILSVSLHYRRWERDILPTAISSGLFEIYRWWETSIGLEFSLHKSPEQILTFYTRVFSIYDPVMEVHLHRYGRPELALGAKGGGEIGFNWSSPLARRSRLGLSLGLKKWSFGRSDNKRVVRDDGFTQSIFEPRSQTETVTIQLQFLHRL
jgi:hypothetical protein